MSPGICLITAGLFAPNEIEALLKRCGLAVWTPASPDADDGHIYGDAICMVIDMPRDAGFRTLKLFRDYGIATPAVLVVDPGLEAVTAGLESRWAMDVLPRTADPRDVLNRIECLCLSRIRGIGDAEEPSRPRLRA